MTFRSWKYTTIGILAAVAITAPVAVILVVLSTVVSDSSLYATFVLMYWILLVTLGIGVAGLLRQYKWRFDRSKFPTGELPGHRRKNEDVNSFDIYLTLGFLVSGYSIFVGVLLGFAVIAGIFFGVIGSVLVVIGVVLLEKWMNREWDKSLVAGGIKITRRLYISIARPNLMRKKRIHKLEALAQQWSLIPFNRVPT